MVIGCERLSGLGKGRMNLSEKISGFEGMTNRAWKQRKPQPSFSGSVLLALADPYSAEDTERFSICMYLDIRADWGTGWLPAALRELGPRR